jgi:hypothetical protein
VGSPSAIEIEFGITSTYEVANYDDVRVATARVRIPLFSSEQPEEKPAVKAKKDKDK